LSDDLEDLERVVDSVIRELRRQSRDPVGAIADLADVVRDRVAFWAALAEEQGRPYRADIRTERALVNVPAKTWRPPSMPSSTTCSPIHPSTRHSP